MQVVVVIILILGLLLVIFTLQNSMEITINLFFWKIEDAPLVIVLLSCLIAGYLIAAFYFYPRLWKLKREYKHLIKFNKELKELHDMEHKETDTVTNPEGIELDAHDDDGSTFFRD
ncbi:MAG: LapA family protein [Bacteroidota bacterium]